MQIIGTMNDGSRLASLSQAECDAIDRLARAFGVTPQPNETQRKVEAASRADAAKALAKAPAKRMPRLDFGRKAAKPAVAKAAAKTHSKTAGAVRNKTCQKCGIKFYDSTRANRQRFCGGQVCRRAGTRVPGADAPKVDLGNGGSQKMTLTTTD